MSTRIPSDPTKRLALWMGLSSPSERAKLLSAAIARNRFEMFTTACQAPAPVDDLEGSSPYERLRRVIAQHDLTELLDAVDTLDHRFGYELRQLSGPRPRRELASGAIISRALKVFCRLLDEGLDPREIDRDYGTSLFHMMASLGWWAGVDAAQSRLGLAHDLIDARKRTMLHTAARSGHADIVRNLIAQGGNINAQEKNGRNVFFFCLMGHNTHMNESRSSTWESVAQILIEHGADLDAPIGKTARSRTLRDYIADEDPQFLPHAERVFDWVRNAKDLESSTPAAPSSRVPKRL